MKDLRDLDSKSFLSRIHRSRLVSPGHENPHPEKEFFVDNLLVRIHLIIVMVRWTGLAPLAPNS